MRAYPTLSVLLAITTTLCFTTLLNAQTSPVSDPALVLTRSLRIGARGSDVAALQQFLQARGFFTHSRTTEYFGSYTYRAVVNFQKEHGIEAIGVVGPKTRARIALENGGGSPLNAPTASTRSIPGSPPSVTSAPIRIVQSLSTGNAYMSGFGGGGPDVTAPTISGTPSSGNYEATSGSGATVTYTAPTASDNADGTVSVSCAPSSGSTFAIGASTVTCSASDRAGNSSSSTFTVTVRDTTAPSVSLSVPASAATLSGSSVTISATASDLVGVVGVQFKIDSANTGSEDTSSPYSISWDSTSATNASHTIAAVARDSAGNLATSTVTATVDNAGPTLSSISAGTPAQTAATITWTTNELADSQVAYGTTTLYSATTTLDSTLATSHSVSLSSLIGTTTYHYRIRSADGQGNVTYSSDQTFITDRLALNSRIVFLGDSITAGSSGPSFANPSLMYAGGRYYVPPTGNQGIGGNTTAQMLTRSTTTLSLSPKAVAVLGGTNDITGTSLSATEIEANLRSIYDTLIASSSKVIAITILPRGDSTYNTSYSSNETKRLAINAWMKTQTDISVVDIDSTAFATSTMTVDGLHPNRAGAYYIAGYVGTTMASLISTSTMPYVTSTDWNNALSNNTLADGSGSKSGPGGSVTGVVATGWTLAAGPGGMSVVGSKATTTDGYSQQVVTITGTATSSGSVTFYRDQSYSGAIGDVYDVWADVEVSGVSGAIKGFFNGADGVALWEPSSSATSTTEFSGTARSFGQALTVTRTTSRVQFGFYVSSGDVGATLKISRPTWRPVPSDQ